jgi:hypothetical protein
VGSEMCIRDRYSSLSVRIADRERKSMFRQTMI